MKHPAILPQEIDILLRNTFQSFHFFSLFTES